MPSRTRADPFAHYLEWQCSHLLLRKKTAGQSRRFLVLFFWHYMQALRDRQRCDFIHGFAHDTDNLIHISKAGPTFNARTASLYC
jgi:hypothetical protein